jgi:ATP-dependent Lon protease
LDYIEGAREAFEQMTLSFESIGIIFSYEFDENIHDRSILLDNGWKILLGRGLDLWQKTGGWYDVNEYIQEKRLCKACEVTIIRN